MPKGSLFIITAASGTGKTSLVKQLLATTNDLAVSVSHSTREPRPGEVEGQHYHFISREAFNAMIGRGEFLEFADVFDNFYGTSQASVDTMLARGLDVILEIDWQGALQVKKLRPDAISIFILPPDRQSLRQRLSGRAQDSVEVIEKRLAGAVRDMQQYLNFDYVVVNDNFDVALADLKAIIMANRLTLARQQQTQATRIERLINQ